MTKRYPIRQVLLLLLLLLPLLSFAQNSGKQEDKSKKKEGDVSGYIIMPPGGGETPKCDRAYLDRVSQGCTGATLRASAPEGCTTMSFTLYGPDGTSSSNGSGTPKDFTVTRNGTYYVVGQSPEGQFTSNTVTVTSIQPDLFSMTGGGGYCQGGGGVPVGLSGSQSGVSYQLKRDGVNIGTAVAGTGQALNFGYHTTAGSYTVLATNTSSACARTMSGGAQVTVNPLPQATVTATGPTTFCDGGEVALVASAGDKYAWNTGETTQSILVRTGGSYWVTVTSVQNCSATSAVTQVTVKPKPVATITTEGATTFCEGGSVLLRGSTGAGYSYEWTRDGSVVGSTPDFTATKSGAYRLTTSLDGCTTTSSAVQVTVNPLPQAPAAGPVSRIGAGTVTLSVSSPSTGYSYSWYTATTGGTLLHTGTSYTPTLSKTTTFYVAAQSGQGCGSTGRMAVTATVHPAPVVRVQKGSVYLAPGASVTLATDNTYESYQWLESGRELSGKETATLIVSSPGDYAVRVEAGTAATSAVVQVRRARDLSNMNYVVENTVTKAGVGSADAADLLPVDSVMQQVTYFDGLGRPLQTVLTQASPQKGDVVTPATYDAFGRTDKTYLPYVLDPAASGGAYRTAGVPEQKAFYAPDPTVTRNYSTDAAPFAVPVYEASPLNRVLEQGAPGQAWQPYDAQHPESGHTVKTTFRTNSALEVRLWEKEAATPAIVSSTYYQPNTLYVTETRDEQDAVTVEYKDKQGRVVMKKVQEAATVASTEAETGFMLTQYIYDDLGDLVLVIQPEGTRRLPAAVNGTVALDRPFRDTWCFRYEYDGRRRVIEKQVPGAGAVQIVYNKLDLPVLTQDSVQRTRNEWMFTKYDVLNRPVVTGVVTLTGKTRAALQEEVNTATVLFEDKAAGGTVGYTLDRSYPAVDSTALLAITYYDDYTYAVLDTAAFLPELGYTKKSWNRRVLGQVTGTRTRVLGTSHWLTGINFYDDRYRLIQGISDGYLQGQVVARGERVTSQYDFTGRVLGTLTTHQNGSRTHTVRNQMAYDHMGRLLETTQQTDSSPEVVLARLEYNELGQVVDKKLHATSDTTYLQSVDMRYNIRGWLTSINNGTLTDDGGGKNLDTNQSPYVDLFGMELSYSEGLQLGSNAAGSPDKQYNGNISEMRWKSAGDGVQRGYLYAYDKANRLLSGSYKAKGTTAWDAEPGYYNVSGISYDLNGNIKSLQRSGLRTGNAYDRSTHDGSYGLVDNLDYHYEGNRLASVGDTADAVVGPAGDFRDNGSNKTFVTGDPTSWEYGYDANGNMTRDENKKIRVSYNYLNLPDTVYVEGKGYIAYAYAADGRKLRKQVYEGSTTPVLKTTTDYAGLFVHQADTVFAHTAEGRVLQEGNTWRYEYSIKDHLGNLRVTFAEPDTTLHLATMEAERANQETQFNGFGSPNVKVPVAQGLDYTHKTTNPVGTTTEALRLNRYRGNTQRPGITLKVMPGDKVKARVRVKYVDLRRSTVDASVIAAALMGMASGYSVVSEAGGVTKVVNSAGSVVATLGGTSAGAAPSASLSYYVLNEKKEPVAGKAGFVTVNSTAAVINSSTLEGAHQLLELTVPEMAVAGYVRVEVSHDALEDVDVYFDDLEVEHGQGILVQENHYDPWGLNLAGIERQNTPDHKFQYNGKEKQTELGLNWMDYGARMYDAQIGRWHVVDPLADEGDQESWTPYHYVYNNPLAHTDPDGQLPNFIVGAIVGAATDYGVQVAANLIQGKDLGDALTDVDATSIATSAAIGAATSGLSALNAGKNLATLGATANKVSKTEQTIAKAAVVGKKVADKVQDGTKKVDTAYKRPSNATTKAQRESVQGKPCVDCGSTTGKRVADHKKPLVKEHYETGKIDKAKMRDVKSVQPQCTTCSAKQGAEMSRYSKEMKKKNGL